MFNGKNILVAGGTGLVGIPLVEMLITQGAHVRIASLDDASRAHPQAEFVRLDLTNFDNCLKACTGMDAVFQLLCIKGPPGLTTSRPASFFVPTILFNTNLMEAARRCGVKNYLYSSTVGVYAPAEVFYEDDVWRSFPSENDRFAGWAKRMGELQAEAYKIEHGWDKITIVRPPNVYGPFDNFDADNAMVIPSLVRRALDGENPLVVWGDGSAMRDFIHAKDCARGMMLVMQKNYQQPINLGSGKGATIREIVEIIVDNLEIKPKVVWDTSKPTGDKKRIMDITRAQSIGFQPLISLDAGIKDLMDWYSRNKSTLHNKRYNAFTSTDSRATKSQTKIENPG